MDNDRLPGSGLSALRLPPLKLPVSDNGSCEHITIFKYIIYYLYIKAVGLIFFRLDPRGLNDYIINIMRRE